MEKQNTKSIIDMAMGAIKERIDYEMAKVISNIQDPNTKAAKKRSIVVQLDITPDDERERLQVTATAKSKLEATNPITTSLYLTDDENGEPAAIEMVPQIPGQMHMAGSEQQEPNILRIYKQA